MSLRPFDTHEYVKELIQGGFSPQLAEANMHALVKALDFTIEHKLATKEQLQATNDELKKVILKLDEFETKFESKLATFETKFATKEELQNAVRHLESKIQNLDHKIDKVFLKTVVTTGSMMAIMMTITCSFLGFLIKF